jgi:transcriptional regulator with XRE-family HTH domain
MPKTERRRWFLREWRLHRGYTQDRLAELAEISKPYLSQLETGKRQYSQDLLEHLADALRCGPSDLLNVDPSKGEDAIWSIYETLDPLQRRQVAQMLRVIQGDKSGTEG